MSKPVRRVSAWELRRYFNEARIHERAEAGELLVSVNRSTAAPPSAGQPDGTLSQSVWYFELRDGMLQRLALAHRFLQPDGRLGGSGRPDPKRMIFESEVLLAGD